MNVKPEEKGWGPVSDVSFCNCFLTPDYGEEGLVFSSVWYMVLLDICVLPYNEGATGDLNSYN